MEDQDLSHIYANSDLDAAQQHHDNLPLDARIHMAKFFAHKAGLRDHPGRYSGPPIQQPKEERGAFPSDLGTKQLAYEMGQKEEQEAIAGLAGGGPPLEPPTGRVKRIKRAAGIPPSALDLLSDNPPVGPRPPPPLASPEVPPPSAS
jgi:hypothetical protein